MASACFERDLGLAKDFRGDESCVVGNDAAGIDHAQQLAGPLGFAVKTVAGDARLVADNGAAGADQTVEERGLADVGAADDGERADDRQVSATVLAAGFVMDSAGHQTGTLSAVRVSNDYYRDVNLSPCLLRHNPSSPSRRTFGGAHSHAVPVLRTRRRAGKVASGIRVSPRTVANGRSCGAGAHGEASPDRRGRHGNRQDAGVSAAGDPLGQARHHLDRHQDAAGAALPQRPVRFCRRTSASCACAT